MLNDNTERPEGDLKLVSSMALSGLPEGYRSDRTWLDFVSPWTRGKEFVKTCPEPVSTPKTFFEVVSVLDPSWFLFAFVCVYVSLFVRVLSVCVCLGLGLYVCKRSRI